MRILLIGLNYAPEPVGIGPYSAGMAADLVRRGHEVRVIAGKPYYPQWKADPAFRGGGIRRGYEDGVEIWRVPHYIPAKPSGAKRLIHHANFALRALGPALRQASDFTPDLVMTVAPSIISAPVAAIAARVAGAKLWLHIQDFEVEAAFATGLLKDGGVPARLARGFEGWMLKRADRVSTISPQMCAKLAEKGIPAERIVEFRNWASIDEVTPLVRPSAYRDEWGIARPHVALYSGNIANKQGIEIVMDVARRLAPRTDLQFVICGNGANRDALVASAGDLDNVQFHDLQPKERLGELLGLADVHLLPQLAGAADLVLPSKLTNMLASGRPVVATAALGTGLADEVAGCGLIVPPGDDAAMAQAIATVLDSRELARELGAGARLRAEERWSRDAILERFVSELTSLATG